MNENERTPAENTRSSNVYPSETGGWIYEVWIAARPVVVGWSLTRESALHEASLA